MNDNANSLAKHALKLYNLDCEYNTVVGKTSIIVNRLNNKSFTIFDTGFKISSTDYYSKMSTKSLNPNIRSFINHWIQYYNFTGNISYVNVGRCNDGMYNVCLYINNTWSIIIYFKLLSFSEWKVYKW